LDNSGIPGSYGQFPGGRTFDQRPVPPVFPRFPPVPAAFRTSPRFIRRLWHPSHAGISSWWPAWPAPLP